MKQTRDAGSATQHTRYSVLILLLLLAALHAPTAAAAVSEDPKATALLEAGKRATDKNDYAKAEVKYRAALTIVQEREPRGVPFAMNRLAEVLRAQDKFKEAEQLSRQSLTLTTKHFTPRSFQTFDAKFTLGLTLVEYGRRGWREATQLLEEAANLLQLFSAEQLGELTLAENESTLGIAFVKMDAHPRGKQYLNRVLPYFQKRGKASWKRVAEIEHWLGYADYLEGHYASSEAHHRRALAFYQKLKWPEHSQDVLAPRFMLGRALSNQQNPEAEKHLRLALTTARKIESDPEKLSLVTLSLSGTLIDLKHWQEGGSLAEEAYRLGQRATQYDQTQLALASLLAGIAYRYQNDIPQATARLNRAVNLYTAHPQNAQMFAYAAHQLAELLWIQQDYCGSQSAYQTALAQTLVQPKPDAQRLAELRSRIDQLQENIVCSTRPLENQKP